MKPKTILAWSGGKDSALALQELLVKKEYDILSLLTTVTDGYDRISMHGVRRSLLESQAKLLDLPLDIIRIPQQASDEDYGRAMSAAMDSWRGKGVDTVAFGDIHLMDVRKYREENLGRAGMNALFPLWGMDPTDLARRFIETGFKAIVTCTDTSQLDGSFAGRELDRSFLSDLPQGVDHCGEKGEFHSFVFDGPIFTHPVPFRRGRRELRDGRFMYADLEPCLV